MILIAFRHSDTRPFARLVTFARGGDSAHCEVAIPVQDVHLCVSSSFLDNGVRGKVIGISNPAKWRMYVWKGPHLDPLAWLREHDGEKYDLRGLLGILAPRVGHDRKRRFCSVLRPRPRCCSCQTRTPTIWWRWSATCRTARTLKQSARTRRNRHLNIIGAL